MGSTLNKDVFNQEIEISDKTKKDDGKYSFKYQPPYKTTKEEDVEILLGRNTDRAVKLTQFALGHFLLKDITKDQFSLEEYRPVTKNGRTYIFKRKNPKHD